MVSRQFSLETSCKELNSQLEQRREENRELIRRLENEGRTVNEREKMVTELQGQLSLQEGKHKLLMEKVLCYVVGCGFNNHALGR